jgi:hypothetical protein
VNRRAYGIARKLEKISPHLSEHERILIARSLAATPDERWDVNQKFLRSVGLSTLSERKKFGFKSPDLPERQYMRVINIARSLGAEMVANTVVELNDGALVNFLYRVDGLASFRTEAKRAVQITWLGATVKVLPLDRLIKSKEVVARLKDLAHLPILREILHARKNGL